MRIAPIIAHIETCAGLGYLGVEGAREYRALAALPGRLPRGYVIPLDRATNTLSRTGVIAQESSERFAVVTLIGQVRAGEAISVDMLSEIEARLIAHMTGWRHPDAKTPVISTGGQDISVELGAYAWATTFSMTTTYRKALEQ